MTPQPNHYAIYTGGFKPVVVQIRGIAGDIATIQEGDHHQLRAQLCDIVAYGPLQAPMEAAVAKMMKVRAQGDRMRAKARNWVKDENERIAREAMEMSDVR